MKTRYYFLTLISVLVVPFLMSSCSREDIPEIPSDEYIEVPLKFSGEITELGQEPLSRAGSTDLLYVQVMKVEKNGSGDDISYPYAHGLFNDAANLSLRFKRNQEYSIQATMIADGVNKVFCRDGNFYAPPFNCPLTNSFIYTQEFDVKLPYEGTVYSKETDDQGYPIAYYHPEVLRYYGIIQYTPSENTPVNIPMAKTVFGLTVQATNLTEGRLWVNFSGAPQFSVTYPATTESRVFSMNYLFDAYMDDTFYEFDRLTIYWEDGNGYQHLVGDKFIKFFRNKRTTVKVTIGSDPETNPGNIGVTVIDEPMTSGGDDLYFGYARSN